MSGNSPSDQRRAKSRASLQPPAGPGEQAAGVEAGPSGVPELFPAGAVESQSQEGVDENAVTPAEQAQYTQIVSQFANVLYKQPKAILDAINNSGDPIHVQVGRVVAQIGQAIEQKAEAAGEKLDADVMFHAGDEVVGMVLDLAIKGRILKLDPESDEYQKVHGLAMMEAEKAFGEKILADPKKAPLAVDAAGNAWAQGIAKEVDDGTADPEFMKSAQSMIGQRTGQQSGGVAEGVSSALRGGGG